MSIATKAASRAAIPRRPADAGQPDPRPLTEYTAAYSEVAGNSRVTVILDQPCIIRAPLPHWAFLDSATGARSYAPTVTVIDNRTFRFDFVGKIAISVGFIEVPYQDMQVQNFQGGFVRPGAQWFRPSA